MTTGAKIILSDKELELVCNTDWILTKHTIIQKVYQLFGDVLPALENVLLENKNGLPAEVFATAAKISKGENYRLLPYVVLDYPRCFGKEDTLAIRSFFWWGNFFSVSLQLSGRYLKAAAVLLENEFECLQQQGYWICVNQEPWEHHFEGDNFIALRTLTQAQFREMLLQKPFIKLAKKIPLNQWNEIPLFITESFEEMAGLLSCH